MQRAGSLDRRARFERRDATADDYGNVSAGNWVHVVTVWASLSERPGREAVRAGRVEASATGALRIRDSAAARGITTADRAVIDGEAYAILDVRPPQRSGVIEMVVQRGGVQ